MASGKQAGAVLEQSASTKRAHILTFKHEAEKAKWEMVWAFEISEPSPSDSSPPAKTTPPNPSQTVPLAGDQASKHMKRWGPFSFESHRKEKNGISSPESSVSASCHPLPHHCVSS